MKLLKSLALAVILTVVGAAKAHSATEIFEGNFSSCTWLSLAVSSANTNNNATPVFSATLVGATTNFLTLMENRDFMEIENVEKSTHVFVRMMVGLSSTSANGDLSLTSPSALTNDTGTTIAPAYSGMSNKLNPRLNSRNLEGRVLIPYLVNDGAIGTSKVRVRQCKR